MLRCIYCPISAEFPDLAKLFAYWESMRKENKVLGILKDCIFDFLVTLQWLVFNAHEI